MRNNMIGWCCRGKKKENEDVAAINFTMSHLDVWAHWAIPIMYKVIAKNSKDSIDVVAFSDDALTEFRKIMGNV